MYSDGALTIGPACAVRGILNRAVRATVDDNMAKTVHVNRATPAPVRGGENCSRQESKDNGAGGSSAAAQCKKLPAGLTRKNPTKIYGGTGADLI